MNFFGMGIVELITILVIALLVLGPNKMVDVARTMGKYVRQIQQMTSELPKLLNLDDDEPQTPPAQRRQLPEQTAEEKQDSLSKE